MHVRVGDIRRIIDGLGENEMLLVTLPGAAQFFNHEGMCPRVDRIDFRWREIRIHLNALPLKEFNGDDHDPQSR